MAKRQQVNFDFLQIGLASPERIRSWSRGEVKKPETINYRTLKPERDGLFCEKIFGPSKDWECYCGRYKRVRHKGIVCPRCGVEVTESKVRRERMGHIDLAAPVVHIWYFKGTNSYLGQLLGIPTRELEEVIYFNAYLVLDNGKTDFKKHQILYEDEYEKYLNELGGEADTLKVGMGAEAIKDVLENIDLAGLSEELKKEAKEANKTKLPKIQKRRKIVENFLKSGNDPVNILTEALPVLPPDLRPMVQLDGGRFATSDLNDLYRRVINRNNRLKKLKEIFAPEIIIRNEKRMLQEAVDALIANGKRGKVVVGTNNRPLKSLTNIIEGKQGRFRQNLLGKRVDYSGRSVIVVGPTLKLHQCGLPKEMAIELFKPFVMHRLMAKNYVQNIKAARMMIERNDSRIWDCLAEVIKDHYILLNRAPTLHRLGIQAFEPILIEGRAIKLHPLVCTAFNADFDGDQMAIHIPLSVEAQAEAQLIMAADNNVLSPATGRPIIVPAQDMVLGCYYLTIDDARDNLGKGMVFTDENEAITAYDLGKVGIHANIKVRINYNGKSDKIDTTVGRVIFNQALPEEMRFVNKTIDKKALENIINDCYLKFGTQPTAHLADRLKELGYKFATQAGVSISITDLVIPQNKKEILAAAEESIEKARHSYLKGEITEVERYSKVIDTWAEVTEELTSYISSDYDKLNSVYMMAFSGARGNISQVRQLVAMRGLMADPSGRIIDMPIKSNFREGLNVTEYVISTYGARKGIVDTALRTADSGYLTRRLVDVAQDVIVRDQDCGSDEYITMKPIEEGEKILVHLGERVRSRYTAEPIVDPKTGEVLLDTNQPIDLEMSKKIDQLKLHSLKVRSVLTCKAQYGVCQKCYGYNLSNQQEAEIGDAVGIIAAQSIGEPGTQLTMRTFHTGGVYSAASTKMILKSKQGGTVKFTKTSALHDIRTRHGLEVKTNESNMEITIQHADKTSEKLNIPASFAILVHDGQIIGENAIIAESMAELNRGARKSTEKGFKEIRADFNGELLYDGFNVNIIKEERHTKQNEKGTKQADKAGVIWLLAGEVYPVLANAELKVKNGDAVKAGTTLATANITSKFGGMIRFGDISVEKNTSKDGLGKKLIAGKDITIEIAKIGNKNGKVDTSKRNLLLKLDNGQVYNLKVNKDSKVEHGMILAESLPDDKYIIKESGQILIPNNTNIEKDTDIVNGTITVLFVPTEAHKVHKDISLLKKVSGSRVDAGTELVKDIYADNDGVVEVTIINDIIDEIKVWRSLEDFTVPIDTAVLEKDGALIKSGTSLTKDIKAKRDGILKILNLNENKMLIIRPVQKYDIEVDATGPQWKADGVAFGTVQKTKLNVKHGEIINVTNNTVPITKKEVILNLPKELNELIGQVEFIPLPAAANAKPSKKQAEGEEEKLYTLQIVLLESVALSKNFESAKKVLKNEDKLIDTYMLIEDETKVKKNEPIATSIVRSKIDGFASIGMEGNALSSLVIVPHNVYKTYKLNGKDKALVKMGDIIREGTKITEAISVSEGGEVSNITKDSVTIRQGRPYLIKAGTLLMQENKSMVQQGDTVATLIYEKLKTGDIIQGLPRVEELLEAREPKDTAVLAEIEGTVLLEMNNDIITKLAIIDKEGVEHDDYTKKTTISSSPVVNNGDKVKPGDMLVNGVINPHDLVRTKGVTIAQTYLVDSIQQVYRSQGVAINDKHIEVIVRQMTKKVRITEPGDTKYLVQELAERREVVAENEALQSGAEKAEFEDILLGITKASLNTTSFISAASFQETGRVLTEAAIEGKKDFLRGLKENVIIGRLIPAGTGLATLDNPIYEDNIEDEEPSYSALPEELTEFVADEADFSTADTDEVASDIEISDEEIDMD